MGSAFKGVMAVLTRLAGLPRARLVYMLVLVAVLTVVLAVGCAINS